MSRKAIRAFVLLGLLTFAGADVGGSEGDWPQWRGPNRDGHAADQRLLESWPEQGPEESWQFTAAGHGYSSVVVADGHVYTLGADTSGCFAICLNLSDGALIWKTGFSATGTSDDYDLGWGGGPRSTPAISGTHLYVLSDIGVVACLHTATGAIEWTCDLVAEHGGSIPDWGYSDSPLVDGDRIVVTPGESNFLIALQQANGKKTWGSVGVDAPAQYASVMKGTVGSTSYYVTASQAGLHAFDAQSGNELFSDTSTGNAVAVVSTPIIEKDLIYHSSGYGGGSVLLQLRETAAHSVAIDLKYHLTGLTMRNHHGGVVLVQDTIYGFTEANRGLWIAQDFRTGETLWEERRRPNRSGSVCFADGHLYCYNDTEGSVLLIRADRRSWKLKGSLTIPRRSEFERGKGAIWSHPVIADQRLIIRDQEMIHAFHIGREDD